LLNNTVNELVDASLAPRTKRLNNAICEKKQQPQNRKN
jgi:hypothetical protein